MKLGQFKEYVENSNKTIFNYGISIPFSWRGSYREVAFKILKEPMTRDAILDNIDCALNGKFHGYKGGDYKYSEYTPIHFEEDCRSYTDGLYCSSLIADLKKEPIYTSREHELVSLIF